MGRRLHERFFRAVLRLSLSLSGVFFFYPPAAAAQDATPTPTPTPMASPAPRATPPPGEVRALWVVRTTLTSPDKIKKLVENAQANGFNNLIVQVRGRGDAYYQSRWEPRAAALKDSSKEFDPLALTIKEAHRKGL